MQHVAIVHRRYVDLILDGSKRVECRLTRTRKPPFGTVKAGERVWIKETSGPVRAAARVAKAQCLADLTPSGVEQLRRDFNALIRGDAAFWRAKRGSRFATLIWLENVRPVERGPAIPRSRGAAWFVLPPARATR
jgi:hypothetical protein